MRRSAKDQMTRPFTALVCVILAAGGGCEVKSKLFCEKNPNDPSCGGTGDSGAIDTPATSCTSSTQCTAHPETPECDTNTGACVQCFDDNSACTGSAEPTCGSNDMCRPCQTNPDCTSNACLDDGTCAPTAMVAYVAPGGTGSACSITAPCGDAVTAVGTGRPYVRLIGSTSTAEVDTSQDITFLGDQGSSTLTGTSTSTFVVSGGAFAIENTTLTNTTTRGTAVLVNLNANPATTVTIERCTLTGHDGGAVVAAAGKVTISRSTIHHNSGGGLDLGGTQAIVFDVTNNFIFRNGDSNSSEVAAASLHPAPGSVFELNTIVINQDENPVEAGGGGVFCVGAAFTLNDNIIAQSTAGTETGSNANLGGTCNPGSSKIAASIAGFSFASPAGDDYHLTAASSAVIDQAVGSAIKIDFDGQVRPNGSASDIGADELYPTE